MAYEIPVHKPGGLKAAADLSAAQFLAVKLSADLTVNLAGAGEMAHAILQNKPLLGEGAELIRLGGSKAVLGGTVAAGDKLASDAAGKLVVAGAGNHVIAIALEAGAVDEVCSVEVLPMAVPLA